MLTLSGTASVAAYQAALRTVTYSTNSENPSALARTIGFQVSDGSASSNVANRSMTVTPVERRADMSNDSLPVVEDVASY